MTIKELKNKYDRQYGDLEVYIRTGNGSHFHTDSIKWTEDYSEDAEVLEYELMNEDRYNRTVLANTSEYADFHEWYGDKDMTVLCIEIAQ